MSRYEATTSKVCVERGCAHLWKAKVDVGFGQVAIQRRGDGIISSFQAILNNCLSMPWQHSRSIHVLARLGGRRCNDAFGNIIQLCPYVLRIGYKANNNYDRDGRSELGGFTGHVSASAAVFQDSSLTTYEQHVERVGLVSLGRVVFVVPLCLARG